MNQRKYFKDIEKKTLSNYTPIYDTRVYTRDNCYFLWVISSNKSTEYLAVFDSQYQITKNRFQKASHIQRIQIIW